MIDLFAIYRRAVMLKTGISRKEARRAFKEELRRTEGALDQFADEYFERKSKVYWQVEGQHGREFRRVNSFQDRRAAEQRATRAVAEMKRKIRERILMDLELPNGKPLRYATGIECRRAGGFFADVAKHLKATEVVDKHLTEDDLRNICARHFQANANIRPTAVKEWNTYGTSADRLVVGRNSYASLDEANAYFKGSD